MSFRNRLLLCLGIVLLLATVGAILSPWAIARGLRMWLSWAAQQEGVTVEIGKIEAPFLHPVTIDILRVSPAEEQRRDVRLEASRITLDLNFRGQMFSKGGRFLHSITADKVGGSIHQKPGRIGQKLDWRNLQRLLPDTFRFGDVNLDVSTKATAFAFRGVILSASEIESGKFSARQISVASPLLRKTFTGLQGATSWEGSRLTIAGASLAPGLDLESLTIDLSSLTKRRIGLDFNLDAFGGTLRASFVGRGDGKKYAVDLAGSGTNLSLAQISGAAGFLEPLNGSLRASKFTFRGVPGEFLDGTASIWIEAVDFAWRNRHANSVVFGATYYDRRLQVEQLYVQQLHNQLTVNGELRWPKRPVDWTTLPFRGQVNATIPDADAFAQLFGAQAGDFAGALSATGEIDLLEPAATGRLNVKGLGIGLRGVALDSLGANFKLQGSDATLETLEVRHANDFLRGHGTADLKSPHRYSARLTGAINNLADFAPLLRTKWRDAGIGGGFTFDWTGDGTFGAHSGTMQLFAHSLQLPVPPLRSPFDLTLEGTYSPEDIFFRNFKLANRRLSLGGFVMLGRNFIELQALELLLDGAPRADGTIFLPIGIDRWRKTGSLLEAFDERQKFDVDLRVNQLELAALVAAAGGSSNASGLLDGKLAAYGPAASLQVTTNWQLKNLGPARASNLIDFDLHYDKGRADANLRAVFGVSSPIVAHASLPLRFEKGFLAEKSLVAQTEPFSVALDCPALFPATMPARFQPLGANGGLVTGKIDYAGTFQNPQISGAAQLFDVKMNPAPPWPEATHLDAEVRFENTEAVISPMALKADGMPLQGQGSLTVAPPFFTFTFAPKADSVSLARLPTSDEEVSAVRVLGEGAVEEGPTLQKIIVRGKLGSPLFSLTMDAGAQATLFFDRRAGEPAGPLLFSVIAPSSSRTSLKLRQPPP